MEQIYHFSIGAVKSERHSKENIASSGFVSCYLYAAAAAIDDSFLTEFDHYLDGHSQPRHDVS